MNKKQSTETFGQRLLPMAESTKLDDSRRNYSSEFAASYHQSNKKKSDLSDQPISTKNTSSYTSGRSTIDAQTYVDAQSNGFTSRIVRYEEENKKKLKIYNRMYKRPGDFPIVHLDKPKLVLSTKRSIVNPPKIARIGQPDPSIYQTNIRAEILRNGTLMDRREDADSAIVRVDPLDALKEITRKRTHCEDAVNQKQIGPIEKDSTDSVPLGTNFNNSKRQRINNSTNSLSTSENNKKGHSYSKSNEIFSSLSSSSYMLSPPSSPLKRVETTSPINSVVPPQTKRLQSEKSIEPPVIETSIKTVPKASDPIAPKAAETSYATKPTRPKLTLFNRPYPTSTLPSVSIERNDRNDECNIAFVKPRPMTARSRESVDNWLKMKPDEKKRLSLMLSCLSGELDDSDTVDSKDKELESPVSTLASNQNVPIYCPPKDVTRDTQAITIPTSVSSTDYTNINSTATSSSKPTITFTPLVNATPTTVPTTNSVVDIITSNSKVDTTTITPTTEEIAPTPAIVERKGGFSFPLPTKVAPQPIVTAPTTVTPASSTLSPVLLATVTPSASIEPTKTTTTEASKDSTVSYTFQVPKQKASTTIAPAVESTKSFTFGNISTTSESKSTPAFGLSNTVTAKLSEPQSLTSSVDQKKSLELGDTPKPNSFSVFAQSISAGNVEFGKTIPSSSTAVTPTAIFGTPAISNSSSNVLNKVQPPSFGSISTTHQSLSSDKPVPSNMTSLFSSEQTPKQLDPRTSIPSITSTTPAFALNQPSKPTTIGSAPFTFGTPTTVSSAFQTSQPTPPSSFGIKPINATTNIFGSSASQGSATTSIFGASTNSNSNLFDQTDKMSSNNNPMQNLTEPAKTVTSTPNIFGSSAAKPSTFSFSGSNQANPSNIFGGQAATTGNSFNFGGSNQKSDASAGSNSNVNKAFSFGSNVETTKSVMFGNKSEPPTFGSSNISDSVKTFGFTPNNQTNANNLFNNNKSTNEVPKVFSFGGSSSTPAVAPAAFGSTIASTPSFGAASNTPSFGGINSTKSFGGTGATPTFGSPSATLSFGGANVPSTFGGASATPTFGATNSTPTFGATNSTPTFGATNSTPTFGATNSTPTFGATNSTPTFGATNATPTFGATNATPTFGGSNATPTFGGNNATSAFGATNATPTFGGNNATPTFGGNNATSAFGATNATPTFGGNNATSAFGANATPTFGGNNATPTFGSSGSQAFNGNIATPTFGGGATPVFGNSGTAAFTTSTGTADVNKTFNFTGSDPTPSPIPNLFNIGPGNSAPRGRTIRTATRRTYR